MDNGGDGPGTHEAETSSIDDLLQSADWERRLAEARARRERVLAEAGPEEPPLVRLSPAKPDALARAAESKPLRSSPRSVEPRPSRPGDLDETPEPLRGFAALGALPRKRPAAAAPASSAAVPAPPSPIAAPASEGSRLLPALRPAEEDRSGKGAARRVRRGVLLGAVAGLGVGLATGLGVALLVGSQQLGNGDSSGQTAVLQEGTAPGTASSADGVPEAPAPALPASGGPPTLQAEALPRPVAETPWPRASAPTPPSRPARDAPPAAPAGPPAAPVVASGAPASEPVPSRDAEPPAPQPKVALAAPKPSRAEPPAPADAAGRAPDLVTASPTEPAILSDRATGASRGEDEVVATDARVDEGGGEAPPLALGASGVTIYLHAPQGITGGALGAAEAALERTGLVVRGPIRVGFDVGADHVRFYHRADAGAARAVAQTLSAAARDFTSYRPSPAPGTIEVWLAAGR